MNTTAEITKPIYQKLEEQGLVDYELLYFIGNSAESMGPEGLAAYLQSKEGN